MRQIYFTRSITIRGKRVRYQVIGSGEPVILVHGLAASSLWWRRNIPALARHYRVYILDLPGFGSMRAKANAITLAEATEWLQTWMQHVHIQRAHFIGHSMGGLICIRFAARYPEQVASLVLVAPSVLFHQTSIRANILPMLAFLTHLSPAFFPIVCYDFLRAGPRTTLRFARELLSMNVRQDMQRLRVPTLLIWGEKDTLVPSIFAPLAQHLIHESRLVLLRNAGHACMFEQSRSFNAAVLSFLHAQTQTQERNHTEKNVTFPLLDS